MPSCRRCGSILCEKSGNGPSGSTIVSLTTKPDLAKSSSSYWFIHSRTLDLGRLVNKSPHCPLRAADNLWIPSTTSSSGFLPKPTAIIVFLPKKNLLSFHSSRMPLSLLLRMLRTENKKMRSYFSAQTLMSFMMWSFKALPFLLVFVSETERFKKKHFSLTVVGKFYGIFCLDDSKAHEATWSRSKSVIAFQKSGNSVFFLFVWIDRWDAVKYFDFRAQNCCNEVRNTPEIHDNIIVEVKSLCLTGNAIFSIVFNIK